MKTVIKTIKIKYQYLTPESAAKYLRQLHTAGGLSYKFIAEKIGVTPQTVTRWAQAGSEIRPAKQVQIWDLVEEHLHISGRVESTK